MIKNLLFVSGRSMLYLIRLSFKNNKFNNYLCMLKKRNDRNIGLNKLLNCVIFRGINGEFAKMRVNFINCLNVVNNLLIQK